MIGWVLGGAALLTIGVLAMSGGEAKASTDEEHPRLRRALAEWRRGIKEPPAGDPAEIDKYIRPASGAGWGGQPYRKNGDSQWCGFFAGWGLELKPAIRKYHMPGCRRLVTGHGTQGHWAGGTGQGLAPGRRFAPLNDPRAGDVAIFGDGTVATGQHIGIVVGVDEARTGVYTVEGNAFGFFPDGSQGEGVIRTWRPFKGHQRKAGQYYLMHLIRPLPSDFEEAA